MRKDLEGLYYIIFEERDKKITINKIEISYGRLIKIKYINSHQLCFNYFFIIKPNDS